MPNETPYSSKIAEAMNVAWLKFCREHKELVLSDRDRVIFNYAFVQGSSFGLAESKEVLNEAMDKTFGKGD
jgi:hypothetical protein